MSIYTHHLIEALHGAGSHSGDTIIRLSHLMAHLAAAVPKSAKDLCNAAQTPFFDTAGEDFPVAALLGGKGLSVGGWQEVASKVTEAHRPTVQASGAGSIAIGGGVHNSMFITGNNNQVTGPKK